MSYSVDFPVDVEDIGLELAREIAEIGDLLPDFPEY